MAINLYSGDSSPCSSPRLSFSRDLAETHVGAHVSRQDMSLLSDQNFDFNFCTTASFREDESSSASELFFNGVIIPTQMKEKLNSIKKEEEEITLTTTATLVREANVNQAKSFWGFKRSSSLNNYENNYGKKTSSSIWSLPLLFRSNSTGSSSNYNSKKSQKNCTSYTGKLMNNQTMKFSSSSNQKRSLKKSGSGGGSNMNCVRNNSGAPLNVPPPYITKGTSDLLGFNSFFRNGNREKKTKK